MALTMAFAMASCSGSASSGTTSGEDGSAAQVDSSQTGQTSMEFDENATEDPQVSDVEILNKAEKYLKGIVTIPAMAKYERHPLQMAINHQAPPAAYADRDHKRRLHNQGRHSHNSSRG